MYSCSWYSNDKDKNKTKGTKKSAMKQKLKFSDCKKCSEAAKIEKKLFNPIQNGRVDGSGPKRLPPLTILPQ